MSNNKIIDINSKKYFHNEAAEFVYYRTYSKWNEEEQRREHWPETVDRFVNYIEEERGDYIPSKLLKQIKQYILEMKVMPSMRAMWSAGDAAKKNNIAFYNCSYLPIDSLEAFGEVLYILMHGTGVGYSVEQCFVEKLPEVEHQTGSGAGKYVIEDSKEGWKKSVDALIQALWSGQDIEMDYSQIRQRGAKLKSFGGRASGPEPLIKLHEFMKETIVGAQGRKLTSLEVHDIVCEIAEVVVVGGVRRSSLISFSDLQDDQMRHAKEWPMPTRRFMANNSAVYFEKPSSVDFLKEWTALAASGTGERGIYNVANLEKFNKRRNFKWTTKEYKNLVGKDGFHLLRSNPCGEILLRPMEFCNLSEVVIRSTDTFDDLIEKVKIATWIGAIQSTFTHFPNLRKIWRKNCEEERLLGVSLTGQMDNPSLLTAEKLEILREYAIKTMRKACKTLGINASVSVTTVKPSGCQKPDAMLVTENGILSLDEIGDVNGPEWQDHDFTIEADGGKLKTSKFYKNGLANTKRLLMDSGIELEATFNHQYRVLTEDGEYVWKSVIDIQKGDRIPYKVGGYTGGTVQHLKNVSPPYHNTRKILMPERLDEDLAWLLGLYIADGSNHKKGIRIAGNVNDVDVLERAKQIIKNKFNIDATIYERTKGVNNADLYINSTHILVWLKENGLLKNYSHEINVPLIIRTSTRNIIESFIEGYAAGDGCDKGDRGRSFCTTSRKMAEQLVVILRALGQDCKMREMPPTDSSWGNRMRYWVQYRKGKNSEGKYLNKEKRKLNEALDKIGLKDLSYDTVVEINVGHTETYDIEVPETHTYLSDSYVSHNTVSQLVSSASGVHVRYAPYYIRRYRISATDPLFKVLKDSGFELNPENGQAHKDAQTWVVSFPVKSPAGAVTRHDVNAIDQLEHYKKIQTNWCEHNASNTIYVKDEEWIDVGKWVYENWESVVGISFLPYDGGHYEQAPYEEITEETYMELIKRTPKVQYDLLAQYEMEDNTTGESMLACTAGQCEI